MRLGLTKSKVFRLLLVLLVVQAASAASSSTNETRHPIIAAGESSHAAAAVPNSQPPSSPKLFYTMLNVGGYPDGDLSWQQLLLETRTDIADLFKGDSRVKLDYEKDGCKLGPTCDTVTVYKTLENDVVHYYVYIHCNTGDQKKMINAAKMPDIAKRIAWTISAHDKIHELKNEKSTP